VRKQNLFSVAGLSVRHVVYEVGSVFDVCVETIDGVFLFFFQLSLRETLSAPVQYPDVESSLNATTVDPTYQKRQSLQ
jgi:hypothetical protein